MILLNSEEYKQRNLLMAIKNLKISAISAGKILF
jgi:hypothetical protein